MSGKDPVLVAFKVDGKPGHYNVWRYDTPSTMQVLFMHRAESEQRAIEDALKKIGA
jgi:hypothetical protein